MRCGGTQGVLLGTGYNFWLSAYMWRPCITKSLPFFLLISHAALHCDKVSELSGDFSTHHLSNKCHILYQSTFSTCTFAMLSYGQSNIALLTIPFLFPPQALRCSQNQTVSRLKQIFNNILLYILLCSRFNPFVHTYHSFFVLRYQKVLQVWGKGSA